MTGPFFVSRIGRAALAAMLSLAGAVAQAPPPQQGDIAGRGVIRPGVKKPVVAADVPRGYALIIGIGKYKDLGGLAKDLNYTEGDAALVHDVLIKQEGGNFPPENVHVLTGSKATLANIQHEIEEWLPSVAKESDRVLIYFAGHGFLYDRIGYLAPYDVDVNRLKETGYPMPRFGQVVGNRIKARWKVLLTDACHSGGITPETNNEQVNGKLAEIERNILSLTASRKQESSYEDSALKHGVFTYFVAQALQGHADRDGDGVVTADEMIDYVRNHVSEHVRKQAGDSRLTQTPTESGEFESDLILAFNPSRRAGPESQLSTQDGTLVIDSTKDDVQVFLDGEPRGVAGIGKPLRLLGIKPGEHTIQGAKQGYRPDGPRSILVFPGVPTTVTLRIQFADVRKKAAVREFDRGLKLYNKGSTAETKLALPAFELAFREDPEYAEAALYLGRSHQILYEAENALKWLKKAIELNPDYVEAYVSYGSVLLDVGDTREAVTNLRYAVNRDPRHSYALSHLAQAYRETGAYDLGVDAAQKALELDKSNAQAMLWLGDCLRALGRYVDARDSYRDYVRVTDFDSSAVEKIGYYLLSNPFTNAFAKKRPTQRQMYMEQRNIGYFGLCNCERKAGNPTRAEVFCRRALHYDPDDPYSYFELGMVRLDTYNRKPNPDDLLEARKSFEKVIALNAEMAEAQYARKYLTAIEQRLKKLQR
ncbi:MAG: tetratricopeptide repeat protein [Bryobacteraceae bacterium]|nr:tetratricopeptide repeat protein [Bryobacteraceae bacterium]